MKNIISLFIGIFFMLAFSFTGLIVMSMIQVGSLEPVSMEEGEPAYPQQISGIAQQGKEEYIKLGCLYCHSQQVRPKGFGADFERGWGDRQTVARDYILQDRVLLGTMRTGPDLFNVGQRLSSLDWHYLHLYDPQLTSKGSIMPRFSYLFEKRKIENKPSPHALRFPPSYKHTPEEGYEIVPSPRAEALISYLLSLKLNYELPESRFSE